MNIRTARVRAASLGAAATLVSVILSACGSGADAGVNEDGLIEMTTGTAPTIQSIPTTVADREGFFEDHGIKINYAQVRSATDTVAAQTAGEMHLMGNIVFNLLPLVEKGSTIRAAGVNNVAPAFEIMFSKDVKVTGDTWQDAMKALDGGRIGVIAAGTASELYARELFKQAGLSPDQAYVAVGVGNTAIAALENDQVDAVMTQEPIASQAVVDGVAQMPFSLFAGDGPEELSGPAQVWTIDKGYADANPDAVESFLAAIAEAVTYLQDPANKDAVVALLEEALGIDAETAEKIYTPAINSYTDPADPEALDAVVEMAEFAANQLGISGLGPDDYMWTAP